MAAVAAAGLTLTRVSSLSVSWNPSGQPVFMYARSDHTSCRPIIVDPCFYDSCAMSIAQRYHRKEISTTAAEEQLATDAYAIIAGAIDAIESKDGYASARKFSRAACDTLFGLLLSVAQR